MLIPKPHKDSIMEENNRSSPFMDMMQKYTIKYLQCKSKNIWKHHPPYYGRLCPRDVGMVQYMEIYQCNKQTIISLDSAKCFNEIQLPFVI